LIQADCGQPAEAARCVRETESRLGAIDVLVHSAGGPVNGGLFDITPEMWESAFAVHVHAIFPSLPRRHSGRMRAKKEGANHFNFLDGRHSRRDHERRLSSGQRRVAAIRAGARS
jgi:NAD(P)-dependent dehydrogenase (short-subunit alcohol dehydrogenase family)